MVPYYEYHSSMKKQVGKLVAKFGYRISKIKNEKVPIGNRKRPFGDVYSFMEDVKALGFKPKQVIDVGAYNGCWSRHILPVFPDSKYHLIEPQVELESELKEACTELPHFSYTLAGCSSEIGELILTTLGNKDGSTFTIAKDDALIQSGKQKIVPVVTIDQLIEKGVIDIPDVIKADVQGLELDVLRGAKKALGKTELIILECSLFPFGSETAPFPLVREVIDFMHKEGYEVYSFTNFARRPYDNALGQCDICFALSDGFFRKHIGYN